jgi:hypothetical protein
MQRGINIRNALPSSRSNHRFPLLFKQPNRITTRPLLTLLVSTEPKHSMTAAEVKFSEAISSREVSWRFFSCEGRGRKRGGGRRKMSTRFAAPDGDERDAALAKASTHIQTYTRCLPRGRATRLEHACPSTHHMGTHTTRATHTPPSLLPPPPYLLDELIEHGVVLLERLVLGKRHSPGRARWRRRRKECWCCVRWCGSGREMSRTNGWMMMHSGAGHNPFSWWEHPDPCRRACDAKLRPCPLPVLLPGRTRCSLLLH